MSKISDFFSYLLPAAPVAETVGSTDTHVDVTLGALGRALLRGWRFVVFCMVAGLVLGLVCTLLSSRQYKVSMRITPPPEQSSSSSGGGLGAMSALLGRGGSSSNDFNNFLELLHSNALSVRLNQDPNIRRIIYRKAAGNPKVVSVMGTNGFLKGHLTTIQNSSNSLLGAKGNQVVLISANAGSPQDAMYLITHVVQNADAILRAGERQLTQRKIGYLTERLKKTPEAEYRTSLIEMISSETKKEMLIDTADHYAYFELDYPVLVNHPFTPKPKINLALGLLAGMIFGLVFILLRDGSRGDLR